MTRALRERVKAAIIAKLGAPKDFYASVLYEQAADDALAIAAQALRERADKNEGTRSGKLALGAAADMMEQRE